MIPVVDLFGLGLVALSARKGGRRGPAREIYRLIRLSTALIAGCGLYSLTRSLLSDILPAASGLTGFLIYFGGAFALVRLVKSMLMRKLDARFQGDSARRAGQLAGALRGLVLLLSVVTAAYVAPLFPWRDAFTQDSWVGRIPGWFLPEPASASKESDTTSL